MGYRLETCKCCGKKKVVVIEDKETMPDTFCQKLDESCECDEPLKA